MRNDFPATKRQIEFLKMIIDFSEENYYMPSYTDIKEAMNCKSNSTVSDHLTALEKKGYLARDYRKPRQIKVLRNLDASSRIN